MSSKPAVGLSLISAIDIFCANINLEGDVLTGDKE